MRKIIITEDAPCKKCISYAICYNQTMITCPIIGDWIRKHSYLVSFGQEKFLKESYRQAMVKISQVFGGRCYSSRSWMNVIYDEEAYNYEVNRIAFERRAKRESSMS